MSAATFVERNERDPRRELWCAVIMQAFSDAVREPSLDGTEELDRHQARDWLTKPNRDFSLACSLAGLDPIAVRERAVVAIEEADGIRPRRPKIETAKVPPKVVRTITLNGETHTINEWSALLGISGNTIASRLYAKQPPELVLSRTSLQRALDTYRSNGRPGRKLTHAGQTLTISEWARRLGLSTGTLHSRLRSNMPLEVALTAAKLPTGRMAPRRPRNQSELTDTPGVGPNFGEMPRDRRGSVAQDCA